MKQLFNKHNSFLIALVFMVVLARIVPYRKEYNEIFDLSKFIDWGICIIFLLYGLKLNIKQVVGDYIFWCSSARLCCFLCLFCLFIS